MQAKYQLAALGVAAVLAGMAYEASITAPKQPAPQRPLLRMTPMSPQAKRALCMYTLHVNQAHHRAPTTEETIAFGAAYNGAQKIAGFIAEIEAGGRIPEERKLQIAIESLNLERVVRPAMQHAQLDFNNDAHVAMLDVKAEDMRRWRQLLTTNRSRPVALTPSITQPAI